VKKKKKFVLACNLMLEVRFKRDKLMNSVIRLQSDITKYIQQVELFNETIHRSTRSELFLRRRIFTIAISSDDQSFCTRTIVRTINEIDRLVSDNLYIEKFDK
jgi:hypothetical protein